MSTMSTSIVFIDHRREIQEMARTMILSARKRDTRSEVVIHSLVEAFNQQSHLSRSTILHVLLAW
jgi:hypothetical protein